MRISAESKAFVSRLVVQFKDFNNDIETSLKEYKELLLRKLEVQCLFSNLYNYVHANVGEKNKNFT